MSGCRDIQKDVEASEEENRDQGGDKGLGALCCGNCRPANILVASGAEKAEKSFYSITWLSMEEWELEVGRRIFGP